MATTSAAQRRAQAHAEFESFLDECPARDLLQTLGGKWLPLVLAALGQGGMRYNSITRHIAGISPKMLTQTLRTLERDGLITRTVTPAVPVQVDYALTPLGEDLLTVVSRMKTWAEEHVSAIQLARTQFDSRS